MEESEPHFPIDTSDMARQSELYETHILPHEGDFLQFMRDIRAHVDEVLLSIQAEYWYENPLVTRRDVELWDASNLFLYPDKNCFLIVKFFRLIFDEVLREWNHSYIEQFLQSGGIFERSWGGYRSSNGTQYLQNFFQVGDRVLDVAFEEMENEKNTPVHITPIEEGRYMNFHTFSSYKNAVESYYNTHALYPATEILWKYAFFVPFFVIQRESGYVMNMPTDARFQSAEIITFLTEEGSPSIPGSIQEELRDIISMILAFETYTELEWFFLRHIHSVLLWDTNEIERGVFESMEQRVWSIAEKERVSYEQCYLEHAADIIRVLSRIYDYQHDRNYYRRTGKVFVPTKTA